MKINPSARRYFSEAIGTFILVFTGTGAIVINDVSKGAVTHVGVAMTFGLVVMALIYALGDICGAHFNPAVTLGFFMARRFGIRDVVAYVCFQLLGAIAASGLLHLLFPEHHGLGGTIPAGSVMQSFILEGVLTAILMFVILCVAIGPKEKGMMAGIAIGGVVGLEAMFAGPICGASMNPARSIGPGIVSGEMGALWIYIVGPLVGAAVAVVVWGLIKNGDEVGVAER